jgi:hypothetical protein
MMEATDFGKRHDPTRLRPFDGPDVWRILVEREMGPGAVIVRNVRSQDATQVWLAQHENMVQTLAPIEPMSRSAKGFCHGLEGAVRISPMPMPFTRCRNA